MLILVFLLSVLSIPKVWLRPTVADSEANSLIKEEEELRSKRQATFFDLLHLAIEKYANCAEEKLAPLKALSSYRQHETFTYPAKYFSGADTMLGATESKQTKPNVICTKVNLCSIVNQKSLTGPADNGNSEIVGQSLDTRTSTSDQSQTPYVPGSANDKSKVGNTYGFGNFPAQYNPRYAQNHWGGNNFTYVPYYQNFLSQLLYTPVRALGKQLFKTSDLQTVVGIANARQSVHMESCPCKKTISEDPENIEDKNANSCPCLKAVDEELESDGPSEGALDDNVTPCEPQAFNQNLNRLLMQLDEMAENANNKELKQILEKLKMLQSSLDINSFNNAGFTTSTKEPTLVGATALQETSKGVHVKTFKHFSLSDSDHLNSQFKTSFTLEPTEATVDTTKIANTLSSLNKNGMFNSRADVKSTFIDLKEDFRAHQNGPVKDSQNFKSINKAINILMSSLGTRTLADSIDYIEGATNSPAFELNISKFQDSKNTKDEMKSSNFAQSNDFIKPDFNEIVTKSPTLRLTNLGSQNENIGDSSDYINAEYSIELTTNSPISYLNIGNNQDLVHVANSMTTFVSSEDFHPESSKTNQAEATQEDGPTVLSKNNKFPTLLYNQKRLNSNLNTSNGSENHSKITISITSNGSFKNIQVEHQLPDEKKLEINEKEKMNIATRSFKDRYVNMAGTGSRHVKVVKQRSKKDSYIEPILSEIYSGKSKFKTKAPLSIYLHKIEEKPSKLENLPAADDAVNNGNRKETRPTMLKDDIDHEGSDSGEEMT